MTLELTSLSKALHALEQSVQISCDNAFTAQLTEPQMNTIQAGVIQHFEFVYELSWKFIQRWIKLNKSPEDAEPRTRKDLFRQAARYGLINDVKPWFAATEARNQTSHTYDEVIADQVYESAVAFLPHAQYLLQQLIKYND